MSYVKNSHDVEIDYASAVNLMFDDLRERLYTELSPCSEQEFFDAYCDLHFSEFGEVFEPAKMNPQW